MILAIVGSREFGNKRALDYASAVIRHEIWDRSRDSFVTGDAPGVDTLVRVMCQVAGRPCRVLAPVRRRWKPDGFEARNMKIAEACDELLCIRDPDSATYGSGWTADYAENIGKAVTRILIS